ncbi:hypothetical protein [Brevibacillus laterosporus]|nr:hypothetical protein [Brevibacillus laterosporus]
MSYNPKLDWNYDDPVTETDINRWEKGIQATGTAHSGYFGVAD